MSVSQPWLKKSHASWKLQCLKSRLYGKQRRAYIFLWAFILEHSKSENTRRRNTEEKRSEIYCLFWKLQITSDIFSNWRLRTKMYCRILNVYFSVKVCLALLRYSHVQPFVLRFLSKQMSEASLKAAETFSEQQRNSEKSLAIIFCVFLHKWLRILGLLACK